MTDTTSNSKFVNPGFLLFTDNMLLAVGGWIFWLVMSRLATPADIGYSTSFISLLSLISAFTTLGLEVVLLQRSSSDGRKLFGSLIVFELLVNFMVFPVVLFSDNSLYGISKDSVIMFGAIYLMLSGIGVIGRFALLGTMQNRKVLIVDAAAVITKFVLGVLLVSAGYGAAAIILALVSQVLITAISLTALSIKKFGFFLNSFSYLKTIIKAGASNSPTKISRVTIMSLSVILLSFFGIQAEEIGFFYIALMISIFSSGIATSIATMAIPASSISNLDLSTGSVRIGLGLSIPIIAGVVISPIFILNIVNPSFLEASEELVVLGFAAIPSILIANAITKLNNLNQLRRLTILGLIEVVVFISIFFLSVPLYGIMGSAIAVLAGFSVAGSVSAFWLGRSILRSICLSVLSLAIGIAAGFGLNQIFGQGPLVFVVAIAASLVTVIYVKLITFSEFRSIISSLVQRPS